MAADGVRSALLYELFVHFDFASSSRKLLDLRHPLGSSNMDVSPFVVPGAQNYFLSKAQ